MLAGLVRSPSRLAPSRNQDGAEKRAQVVLAAMVDMKFLTDNAAKVALIQPAQAIKGAVAGSIGYVADWIMDVIDDLIGRVEKDIVVETSIDPALQAAAEKALTDELAKAARRPASAKARWWQCRRRARSRALVGGRNYAESQFNRAVGPSGNRFGVQAVRLPRRHRARAHAGFGAGGQADRNQGLASGKTTAANTSARSR